MSNGNSGFNFWPLIIVVAILGYILYAYNRRCCPIGTETTGSDLDCDGCDPVTRYINVFLRKIFATDTKDGYQKCLGKNKTLKEGDPCTTCASEETQPVKSGTIKNGICISKDPVSEQIKGQIQISNQNGSYIYKLGDDQTLKPTNQVIPPATKINYIDIVNMSYCDISSQSCFAPTNFYKLSNNQGYIIYTDASLINPTA